MAYLLTLAAGHIDGQVMILHVARGTLAAVHMDDSATLAL